MRRVRGRDRPLSPGAYVIRIGSSIALGAGISSGTECRAVPRFGYLGGSVGRPGPLLPWYEDGSVRENVDMWAKVDEPSDYLVGLYPEN